jgi:hypothetical protein
MRRMSAFRRTLPALLALALSASPAAHAAICAIENAPAATLLLPYFEVGLANDGGPITLVAVTNSSAAATLVKVVLWSDMAVPVLGFNMYLTGFDEQSFNMSDIIINGNLPQTASTGQDPTDTISPKGIYSQDTDFPSCNDFLPLPMLPTAYTAHLQESLTGQPSRLLGGLCAGRSLGDNVARGYVTIDAVNNCSTRFPGDPGYFGTGGTGDASNSNVLFGNAFLLNTNAGTLLTLPLVHIQASGTDARVTTPGSYTFYGGSDSFSAADNREPLPTTFGVRYLNGNGDTTQLDVWRDPKLSQQPFTCPAARHARPPWFPLGQESIVVFDEQEHAFVPSTDINSPGAVGNGPLPAAVQRIQIGGPLLPVPYQYGWAYLNLNTSVAAAGAVPPADATAAQAWVSAIYNAPGVPYYSSAVDATQFDSACAPNHTDPTSH